MSRPLVLLLIAFVAASCAPAYVSNVRNTPTFGEANEFAAGASLATSGVDLQLAYSLTDNIAVMTNGNFIDREELVQGDDHLRHEHLFGEGGIGYFTKTDRIRFEVFGGYGVAKFKSYESYFFDTPSFVRARYDRLFLQPSIQLGGPDVVFIATTRFSGVKIREYKVQDASGQTGERVIAGMQGFFEPAITARFRIFDTLYGYSQAGINVPMNGPYYYEQNVFQFSFGLQFRTGPKHDN